MGRLGVRRLAIVFAVAVTLRGSVGAPPAARVSSHDLMRVVRELASPPYGGRRAGTEGSLKARAFIVAAFTSIGLEPAGSSGYEQPFRLRQSGDAANVLGRVAGDAGRRVIVVSAHFDHL